MISPAEAVRALLMEYAAHPDPNPDQFTKRLRRALLIYGSETDDNRDAMQRIEMGNLPETQLAFLQGIRTVKSGYSISGILNTLEGEGLPKAIRERFPDLDVDDFDAALRVAVLCLSAFENPNPR